MTLSSTSLTDLNILVWSVTIGYMKKEQMGKAPKELTLSQLETKAKFIAFSEGALWPFVVSILGLTGYAAAGRYDVLDDLAILEGMLIGGTGVYGRIRYKEDVLGRLIQKQDKKLKKQSTQR